MQNQKSIFFFARIFLYTIIIKDHLSYLIPEANIGLLSCTALIAYTAESPAYSLVGKKVLCGNDHTNESLFIPCSGCTALCFVVGALSKLPPCCLSVTCSWFYVLFASCSVIGLLGFCWRPRRKSRPKQTLRREREGAIWSEFSCFVNSDLMSVWGQWNGKSEKGSFSHFILNTIIYNVFFTWV